MSASPAMNPHTRILLEGPILPTLLRLAWPNVLVMLAQASTGLIETWYVSRLGTDALTGMALVFPAFMLMQMLSGGAVGGGIASAVARALGAGRRDDADALVLHGVVVNGALGLVFSALFLLWGRTIYGWLGGQGASLDTALAYSNVVFAGTVLVWLMNALAAVIRGTGNMVIPAVMTCIMVALLIPLSPTLIFGFGPIPALGVAGAGVAVVATTALACLMFLAAILSNRLIVRFRWVRLRPAFFADILRIGAIGTVNTFQTTATVALTVALVGMTAGPGAIAGYGTGGRLEYLLIPLIFGLGAPLVAMVGTNIGAGQQDRALRIALTGGAAAFVLAETIGLAAAAWPHAWLRLFGDDPDMLETGTLYLRLVGPTFGFFGLGLSLYFASQGAGRLFWPLLGASLRMVIAVGGGWAVLRLTGSLTLLFTALGLGLVVYGTVVAGAIAAGGWFPRPRRRPALAAIIPDPS